MFIEVHYDGRFETIGNMRGYVNAKVHVIKEFDVDWFSWFELRYHLKKIGLLSDYKVWQKIPKTSTERDLVDIDTDKEVEHMLKNLDVNTIVVLYIEHLPAGIGKELLPEYFLSEGEGETGPEKYVTDSATNESTEYAWKMTASTRDGELFIGEGIEFQVATSPMKEQLQCMSSCKKHMLTFDAVFVSFSPMIKGMFSGCRPVIGLDGCPLNSTAGDILLSAVARDPNNQMFPVAYAVVGIESKESWTWFLIILLDTLGIDNLKGWTFLSDWQKGLTETFKVLVPDASIRFCVRHLYANFHKQFTGLEIKNLLWKAATAYTLQEWEATMEVMQEQNEEAYNWLIDVGMDNSDEPGEVWSRSHFDIKTKCDLLFNNICEAWNKYLLEVRDKPIITMLEMIRRMLMRRFQTKREQMSRCKTLVCPKIIEILKKNAMLSRECTSYLSGADVYEVVELGHQRIVELGKRECDCREWQLTGIPYRHAMSDIFHKRGNPQSYCDECYYVTTYMRAYDGAISPIPDSSLWPKQQFQTLLPLHIKKKAGRPPKK